MLLVWLCITAIALGAAALLFESLRNKGAFAKTVVPLLTGVAAAFVAITLSAFYFFLTLPLLVIIGWICFAAQARTATFVKWSLGAVLLVPLLLGGFEFRRWANVRRTYPLESLGKRLSYELDRARAADARRIPPRSEQEKQRSVASLSLLEEKIRRFSYPGRAQTLAYAHASQVRQFIDSQGFGVGRMRRPDPYYLRSSRARHDRVAGVRADIAPSSYSAVQNQQSPPLAQQEQAALELEPLHVGAFVDFVNPAVFGWVKDAAHVAGFEPHAFSELPRLKPAARDTKERWRTTRLELVSLRKHEQPMVYVANRLPDMNELRDAPVRPLDAFERQALAKLHEGESLAIDASVNRIRMLGPILAVEQCQQCHLVERGELLGAFSYEFLREPPVAFEPAADAPSRPEL
ncbi:MAG TPA: hypothetical protein VMV10_06305 [Pirellulales bacterium]|nr:hypothetical protein [Pirellulales bacterium]